jgi:hypothetical protein
VLPCVLEGKTFFSGDVCGLKCSSSFSCFFLFFKERKFVQCCKNNPGFSVDDKSSQVKLLITTYLFCVVQRATEQSKTGFFRDYGAAEAPPGFQVGWSDCM